MHDLNIGGNHQLLKSAQPLTPGHHTLCLRMRRSKSIDGSINGTAALLVDDKKVASMQTDFIFALMISWSGLDVGFDRGTTVGNYASPFNFTGTLIKVTVDLDDDQDLDHEAVGHIEMAKE
jgi:hypothetical protein